MNILNGFLNVPIDYKQYPKYWKKLSRHIRFVRANNHCEFCNCENYKPHPVTGAKVVLTVAHLDHDKTNNRFSNLRALCQKCHNNYDKEYRVKNRAETIRKRKIERLENAKGNGRGISMNKKQWEIPELFLFAEFKPMGLYVHKNISQKGFRELRAFMPPDDTSVDFTDLDQYRGGNW